MASPGSEQEVPATVQTRAIARRTRRVVGAERTLTGHLPPVHEIERIFELLVMKGVERTKLLELVTAIPRKLRVGTMCSGTESPVLALGLICDSLQKLYSIKLQFDHTMSAEIEPYKQAYIKRNFNPKLLFRDITDFVGSRTATTAYGNVAEIPADLDLLVAGFSCVDFSRLNSKKKQLDDHGESGDTFFAILHYAKQFRPKVIILENVLGAPWAYIQALWRNDLPYLRSEDCEYGDGTSVWAKGDLAYASEYTVVNTEDFYLPETRQRGYMVCYDRSQIEEADEVAKTWVDMSHLTERLASSDMEAFMFEEEDPRLHRMRDTMRQVMTRKPAKAPRDWVLCKGRYEQYRHDYLLGNQRPFTRWVTGGKSKAPDHWWGEQMKAQVERIQDTLDINMLRSIVRGSDPTYKGRVWDLSQNVDRAGDAAPTGMVGCLVPTGIPFCPSRGRFLLGAEVLSLNGIPRDKLLMTRESRREIIDLAGNAMSSPVVGAAIIAAICACPIGTFDGEDAEEDVMAINPTARLGMRDDALGPVQPLDLLSFSQDPLHNLIQQARNSVLLCLCEGSAKLTDQPLYTCGLCSHTACEQCKGIPAHLYGVIDQPTIRSRINPSDFTETIKKSLPMRLRIANLSLKTFSRLRQLFTAEVNGKTWAGYLRALTTTFGEELRFKTIKRTHKWRVIFESSHSFLTLTFSKQDTFWQLNAKPDPMEPANSAIRTLLKPPFAVMQVNGENLLSGQWQLCLPSTKKAVLEIRGIGPLIPCWEARLGIQHPKFVDEKVWSKLRISVEPGMNSDWTDQITGEYELLQDCDTALHKLHKRISSPGQAQNAPVYLFLDQEPYGIACQDCFVFSKDKHRLAYQEPRMIIASIERRWRAHSQKLVRVTCSCAREVMDCEAVLDPFTGVETPTYAVLTDCIDELVATEMRKMHSMPHQNCLTDPHTILSCKVPLKVVEAVGWNPGPWSYIDQKNEYLNFATFAWLLERVRNLDNFSGRDRLLPPLQNLAACPSCAPDPPTTKWKILLSNQKGEKDKCIPYVDNRQAEAYERAINARPAPFVMRTRIDDNQDGCFQVGLNLTTLVHRALAKFSPMSFAALNVSWSLDSQYEWPIEFPSREFKLGSNKSGPRMSHKFTAMISTKEDSPKKGPAKKGPAKKVSIKKEFGSLPKPAGELREDQEESLHWIVNQESPNAPPFLEMEIEEACVRTVGWRAEVRVQRPSTGRGGILADDIGYGKTITTLALIDRQMPIAHESSKTPRTDRIPLKATLIIVPQHLLTQWMDQISQFFGIKYNVVAICTMHKSYYPTIGELKDADIVLLPLSLFASPIYLMNIAKFAALPEPSHSNARAFNDWIEQASERIGQHTELLKNSINMPVFGRYLHNKRQSTMNENETLQNLPAKRLRGAAYVAKLPQRKQNNTRQVGLKQIAAPLVDDDSFHLSNASSMDEMAFPPLAMFHFERLVVDEYTYFPDTSLQFIKSIKSTFRWVLSGTPRIEDFQDVKVLAELIGVYLGADDDSSPQTQYDNLLNMRRKRTAPENFQALTKEQSPAWHTSRHAHAQKFLDHFARKNIVEFGKKFHSIQSIFALPLTSTHRALYLELQQQLQSTDMVLSRGFAKGGSDRVDRIRQLLKGSDSAEAALVKSAAYFVLGSTDMTAETVSSETGNAPRNTCDTVIGERNNQYQELCDKIKKTLRNAVWLEQQCSQITANDLKLVSDTHYHGWKRDIRNNFLGDPELIVEFQQWILQAEKNHHPNHEILFYRFDPLTADEKDLLVEYLKTKNELKKAKPSTKISKMDAEEEEELVGSQIQAYFQLQKAIDAQQHPNKMVLALREVTASLRSLSQDVLSQRRAFRFLQTVRKLQRWQSELGEAVGCDSCREYSDPSHIFILGICGHVVCTRCLASQDREFDECCSVENCKAAAQSYHIHAATDYGLASDQLTKYGAKLEAIVKAIKGTPKTDQVLLFVQFDNFIPRVAKVLEAEQITHYAICPKNTQRMKEMEEFQKDKSDARKKVLILDPASETAAGINLTNVNHVIFLAPMVHNSFSEYVARMRQSIGRALRYGQRKKVFIYHFLALKTIDVDIFQKNSKMKLVLSKAENWVLKYESNLTDEQRKANWATGVLDDEETSGV